MLFLPPEHPQRRLLSDEVHSRPPTALSTPSRVTHVAVLIAADERGDESRHIADLCSAFDVEWPDPAPSQFRARLGLLSFTWERHGEFSGFTFALEGIGDEPAAGRLPKGWLSALPGLTLVAVHATLLRWTDADVLSAEFLARHFAANTAIGADVAGGSGVALTDFRIHDGAYSRIVLLDRGLTRLQAGRTLQRLFEIEVYRMLALLALPIAQRQLATVTSIETELALLTADLAKGAGDLSTGSVDDEMLLRHITDLAGRVEGELVASQFRFGACRAYGDLVTTRVAELREQRLPGTQTIGEFMDRRFKPAVATVAIASQRLRELSERVARTSTLLLTRVDVARERQNQALLASMDRRVKTQLRLQQAVEGLSVAAIVYYAAGLVGYLAKGLSHGGVPIDPDVAVAIAIPVLILLVLFATTRARRRALADERH